MSIASVLAALREEYRPALAEEVRNLLAAADAKDWPATRRIAHRVGGTAGSYGFKEASDAARAIEEAIDAGKLDLLGPALEALGASVRSAQP